MKKNKLSVIKFPYRVSYYLTHPWKWFQDLFDSVRNFIHRGRYGYACTDVWEWHHWWPLVGSEAMRYMAEHKTGYPGTDDFGTPEKWKAHLLNTADQLEWCSNLLDEYGEHHNNQNEYWLKYNAIHQFPHVWTEEEQAIIEQYYKREDELYNEDQKKCSEILAEIGHNLGMYWD